MADEDAVIYNNVEFVHLLMVSRLSSEKGIDRAIRAVAHMNAQGAHTCLHLVGEGGEHERLRLLAEELGVSDRVIFHGEQSNPYRYMKNADLLLMTSYHEAAPMVIDEAYALGLPVLTTETTSAHDMVTERQCGWVCENTDVDVTEKLKELLFESDELLSMKNHARERKIDNDKALRQFQSLIDDLSKCS
jgi:glycosyltransferase involved in cell wall biosynthesis